MIVIFRNGNSECASQIWTEWGLLFIMTEGHIVYLLREKDTSSKLQILYDRKLYSVAVSLCEEWGLQDRDLSDVHQQY